jgi:transposase
MTSRSFSEILKEMKVNKKKPAKQVYTWEFQQKAVRLVQTSKKSAALVAQELGVPIWRMRAWLRESSEKEERSAEVDEVIRLRTEVKQLKEDNEFLKKAAAYFAKNQP